jgi:hypothetical protein
VDTREPTVGTMPAHLPRRRSRTSAVGLTTLVLLILVTVGIPPSPAAARRPWTPAPASGAYTPRLVWQTRDNCVFASGQMLLDKWTHGHLRISQGRLRKASGDDEGGAGFRDLARGIARTTGVRLRWSPSGGDPLTWWQLLDRLERGGGAVLFGEYGRLPREYTHWAPRFARSAKDDHAVYIERYDRANGRVWLMDPLAASGFAGEWIDVRVLRRFARFDGSLVYAAATPVRHRSSTAPLSDQAYRLGAPTFGPAIVAGTATPVSVPLTIVDAFPLPADHRLTGAWERLDDPVGEVGRDDSIVIPAETRSGALPLSVLQPPETTVTSSAAARATARGFTFLLPAPDRPGRYRLTLGLVPAWSSSGRAARTLPAVEVRVVGPYAGSVTADVPEATRVGSTVDIALAITNLGTVDWRPAPAVDAGPGQRIEATPGRPAVLTIGWRSPTGELDHVGSVDVPLVPGSSMPITLQLAAPATAGPWTLELDVVHPAAGSLASTGMAPPTLAIVVDPASADSAR